MHPGGQVPVPGTSSTRPIELGPNQPEPRPYRGGPGIARLRGVPPTRTDVPEDLVGSTTELAAGGGLGLTVLGDGRTLREHVAADPEGFLGPAHVARFGAEPALLVKLLDTAERLFVHCHPSDDFAARHLHCRFGKTEAWYVVEAAEGAEVHLGFARAVAAGELRGWVDAQDAGALLAALNRLPVRAGDSLLVPAGLPHGIGPGITLVELQEPTDFSILLEWAGYGVTRADADLGLGLDLALEAVDRSAWPADRLATLRQLRADVPPPTPVARVFPAAADPYFRAELLHPEDVLELDAGFAVLVGLAGSLTLETAGARTALRRGSTVLVPHGAGPARLLGRGQVLRARPPA